MTEARVNKNAPLTASQKELVQQNVGLVAVHIKRNVRNLGTARSDRQYEDLFQEGCCGLIQAARSFDPEKGIPFAAYALRRIHTAVSTALYESASPIRTPRRQQTRKSSNPLEAGKTPKVYQLDSEPNDRRRESFADEGAETLGDRLRTKIETAIHLATRKVGRRRAPRSDREALMDMLIRERLLVAEPDAKTALREIARRTGSSYTRVLQCERRILQAVRQMLSGDLEFLRLMAMVKQEDRGADTPLDDPMREELRRLAAAVLAGRLNACEKQRSQEMLWNLIAENRERLITVLLAVFEELDDQRIEKLQIDAAVDG